MKDFDININNKTVSANKIIHLIKNNSSKDVAQIIVDNTGCDIKEAFKVIKELKQLINTQESGRIPFEIEKQKYETKNKNSNEINITRCPRCGGTAFTPLKKKFSILTGFATNKVDLVCNNCGKIVKPK